MKSSHFHPVIRIVTTVNLGLNMIDPIEEHNRIFKREGKVAFAKFGNPQRQPNCNILCEEISKGHTTYLYVVTRNGSRYASFRAPVSQIVRRSNPSCALYPPYYTKLGLVASLWFILSGSFKPHPIDKLWVASSGRPLMESLKSSRCNMMVVTTRRPESSDVD